jgi:TP901 family phage tail tape measure protein
MEATVDRYGLTAEYTFRTSKGSFTQMDRVIKGLGGIESAARSLESSTGGLKSMAPITRQLSGVQSQARSTAAKGLKPLRSEMRAIKAEARNMSFGNLNDPKQLKLATRQTDAYVKSLKRLGNELGRTSAEERQFAASLKTQQRLMKQRLAMSREQQKAMLAAERRGKAGSVTAAGVATAAPMVAIGKKSIKLLADYNDRMSQVQAITGASALEMEALRKTSKKLGASTRFSASQAADGMVLLSQAGYSVSEQTKSVAATLNLASAANLSLARSTNITLGTMGSFQLSAEKAGHVTDVLAQAANSANTNVAQMGLALEYAGAPAKTFGASLEQTVGLLEVLAKGKITSDKAGTALRSVFLRLPARQRQLAQLGVEVTKSNGDLRDINGIIQDLAKSLNKMSDAQKLNTVQEIFGTEAATAVLTLTQFSGELKGINKELMGASKGMGAAARTSAKMEDNIGGLGRSMRSAFEGILLEIGETIEPVVIKVGKAILGLMQGFLGLPKPIRTVAIAGGALAAGLATVIALAGAASIAFLTLQQSMAVASVATMGLNKSMPLTGFFAKGLGALGGKGILFGLKMLVGFAGPIGLVVVAGAALVNLLDIDLTKAAKNLITQWDPMVERISAGAKAISEQVGAAWLKLKTFAKAKLKRKEDQGSPASIGNRLAQLTGASDIAGVASPISSLWSDAVSAIKQQLSGLWEFAKGIGQRLISALAENSPGPLKVIREKWKAFKTWISEQFQAIKENAQNLFAQGFAVKDVIGAVSALSKHLLKTFKVFGPKIFEAITKSIPQSTPALLFLATGLSRVLFLGTKLNNILPKLATKWALNAMAMARNAEILNKIKGAFNGMGKGIGRLTPSLITAASAAKILLRVFGGLSAVLAINDELYLLSGILIALKAGLDVLKVPSGWLDPIITGVVTARKTVSSFERQLVQAGLGLAKNLVGQLTNIPQAWKGMVQSLQGMIGGFVDWLKGIGYQITRALAKGSPGPVTWIQERWAGLLEWFGNAFGEIVGLSISAGIEISKALISAGKSGFGSLINQFADFTKGTLENLNLLSTGLLLVTGAMALGAPFATGGLMASAFIRTVTQLAPFAIAALASTGVFDWIQERIGILMSTILDTAFGPKEWVSRLKVAFGWLDAKLKEGFSNVTKNLPDGAFKALSTTLLAVFFQPLIGGFADLKSAIAAAGGIIQFLAQSGQRVATVITGLAESVSGAASAFMAAITPLVTQAMPALKALKAALVVIGRLPAISTLTGPMVAIAARTVNAGRQARGVTDRFARAGRKGVQTQIDRYAPHITKGVDLTTLLLQSINKGIWTMARPGMVGLKKLPLIFVLLQKLAGGLTNLINPFAARDFLLRKSQKTRRITPFDLFASPTFRSKKAGMFLQGTPELEGYKEGSVERRNFLSRKAQSIGPGLPGGINEFALPVLISQIELLAGAGLGAALALVALGVAVYAFKPELLDPIKAGFSGVGTAVQVFGQILVGFANVVDFIIGTPVQIVRALALAGPLLIIGIVGLVATGLKATLQILRDSIQTIGDITVAAMHGNFRPLAKAITSVVVGAWRYSFGAIIGAAGKALGFLASMVSSAFGLIWTGSAKSAQGSVGLLTGSLELLAKSVQHPAWALQALARNLTKVWIVAAIIQIGFLIRKITMAASAASAAGAAMGETAAVAGTVAAATGAVFFPVITGALTLVGVIGFMVYEYRRGFKEIDAIIRSLNHPIQFAKDQWNGLIGVIMQPIKPFDWLFEGMASLVGPIMMVVKAIMGIYGAVALVAFLAGGPRGLVGVFSHFGKMVFGIIKGIGGLVTGMKTLGRSTRAWSESVPGKERLQQIGMMGRSALPASMRGSQAMQEQRAANLVETKAVRQFQSQFGNFLESERNELIKQISRNPDLQRRFMTEKQGFFRNKMVLNQQGREHVDNTIAGRMAQGRYDENVIKIAESFIDNSPALTGAYSSGDNKELFRFALGENNAIAQLMEGQSMALKAVKEINVAGNVSINGKAIGDPWAEGASERRKLRNRTDIDGIPFNSEILQQIMARPELKGTTDHMLVEKVEALIAGIQPTMMGNLAVGPMKDVAEMLGVGAIDRPPQITSSKVNAAYEGLSGVRAADQQLLAVKALNQAGMMSDGLNNFNPLYSVALMEQLNAHRSNINQGAASGQAERIKAELIGQLSSQFGAELNVGTVGAALDKFFEANNKNVRGQLQAVERIVEAQLEAILESHPVVTIPRGAAQVVGQVEAATEAAQNKQKKAEGKLKRLQRAMFGMASQTTQTLGSMVSGHPMYQAMQARRRGARAGQEQVARAAEIRRISTSLGGGGRITFARKAGLLEDPFERALTKIGNLARVQSRTGSGNRDVDEVVNLLSTSTAQDAATKLPEHVRSAMLRFGEGRGVNSVEGAIKELQRSSTVGTSELFSTLQQATQPLGGNYGSPRNTTMLMNSMLNKLQIKKDQHGGIDEIKGIGDALGKLPPKVSRALEDYAKTFNQTAPQLIEGIVRRNSGGMRQEVVKVLAKTGGLDEQMDQQVYRNYLDLAEDYKTAVIEIQKKMAASAKGAQEEGRNKARVQLSRKEKQIAAALDTGNLSSIVKMDASNILEMLRQKGAVPELGSESAIKQFFGGRAAGKAQSNLMGQFRKIQPLLEKGAFDPTQQDQVLALQKLASVAKIPMERLTDPTLGAERIREAQRLRQNQLKPFAASGSITATQMESLAAGRFHEVDLTTQSKVAQAMGGAAGDLPQLLNARQMLQQQRTPGAMLKRGAMSAIKAPLKSIGLMGLVEQMGFSSELSRMRGEFAIKQEEASAQEKAVMQAVKVAERQVATAGDGLSAFTRMQLGLKSMLLEWSQKFGKSTRQLKAVLYKIPFAQPLVDQASQLAAQFQKQFTQQLQGAQQGIARAGKLPVVKRFVQANQDFRRDRGRNLQGLIKQSGMGSLSDFRSTFFERMQGQGVAKSDVEKEFAVLLNPPKSLKEVRAGANIEETRANNALRKKTLETMRSSLGLTEFQMNALQQAGGYTAESMAPFSIYIAKAVPGAIGDVSMGIAKLSLKTLRATGRTVATEAIGLVGPKLAIALSGVARSVSGTLGDVANAVYEAFPGAKWIGKIEDAIRFKGGAISTSLSKASEEIREKRSNRMQALRQMKSSVQNLFATTAELFTTFVATARSGFTAAASRSQSILQSLKGLASQAFGAFVKGFQKLKQGAGRMIKPALNAADAAMMTRFRAGGGLAESTQAQELYRKDGLLYRDRRGRFVSKTAVEAAAGQRGYIASRGMGARPSKQKPPTPPPFTPEQIPDPWSQPSLRNQVSNLLGGLMRRIQPPAPTQKTFFSTRRGADGERRTTEKTVQPLINKLQIGAAHAIRAELSAMQRMVTGTPKVYLEAIQRSQRPGQKMSIQAPADWSGPQANKLADWQKLLPPASGSANSAQAPESFRKRWEKATRAVTTRWGTMAAAAKKIGLQILARLSENSPGPSAQIRENYAHTADSVGQSMGEMASQAQVEGQKIRKAMSPGQMIGGFLRTGAAVGGAVTAMGFAAQTIGYSLSNLGVLPEETTMQLSKAMEVFSIFGAVASVVAPTLSAMFSVVGTGIGLITGLTGAISTLGGGFIAFVVSPAGLATAAVVGSVLLINEAVKRLFGVDVLGATFQRFSGFLGSIKQGVFFAIQWIESAWSGMVDRFWPILQPIVQPALDIAQQLINALNHNPTEAIPLAWEGAVARIKDTLLALPIVGDLVSGEMIDSIAGSLANMWQQAQGWLGGFVGQFGGLAKRFGIDLGGLIGGEGATSPVIGGDVVGGDATVDVTRVLERAVGQAQAAGAGASTIANLKSLQSYGFAAPTGRSYLTEAELQKARMGDASMFSDMETAKYLRAAQMGMGTDGGRRLAGAAVGNTYREGAAATALSVDKVAGGGQGVQQLLGQVALKQQVARIRPFELGGDQRKLASQLGLDPDAVNAVVNTALRPVNNLKQAWQDRMGQLQRTGGRQLEELFTPGIEQTQRGIKMLGSSISIFAKKSVRSIMRLDFNGLGEAAIDFGKNFGRAATQIIGGFGSMALSAVTFGVFSIASMGPVSLVLGAIALGALAVATNFLGARGVLLGLIKVLRGAIAVIRSLLQGMLQIGRGVWNLFKGLSAVVRGDFGPAISAGKQIVDGFRTAFTGTWQGLVTMVRGATQAIASPIMWLGGVLKNIVSGPRQAWQKLLNLINKVGNVVSNVAAKVEGSAVGRMARAAGLRATGKAGSMDAARQMVDFDERLKGRDPGLTMGDRFRSMFGRKRKAPPVPPAPPSPQAPGANNIKPTGGQMGRKKVPVGAALAARGEQATGALSSVSMAAGAIAPQLAAPLYTASALGDSVSDLMMIFPGFAAKLTGLFGTITAGFSALMAGSLTFGGVMTAVGGAITASLGAVAAVATTAWVAITGPLLPFIAIGAAVVGVVILIWQAFKRNWGGIGDLVQGIWTNIKAVWSILVSSVKQIVGGVFGSLMAAFRDISGALMEMRQAYIAPFVAMGRALIEPFKPILKLFGIDGGNGGSFAKGAAISINLTLMPLKIVGKALGNTIRMLGWMVTGLIKVATVIVKMVVRPFVGMAQLLQLWFKGFNKIGEVLRNAIVAPFQMIWMLGQRFVESVRYMGQAVTNMLLMPFRKVAEVARNIMGVVTAGPIKMLMGSGDSRSGRGPARFAKGGSVRGPGSGIGDRINALLSNGEYVVNADAARKNLGFLDAINSGVAVQDALSLIPVTMPRVPTDLVPPPSTASAGDGGNNELHVHLHFGDIIVQNAQDPMTVVDQIMGQLEPRAVQMVKDAMADLMEKTR